MSEKWENVKWDPRYAISNQGRVFSQCNRANPCFKKLVNCRGYLRVGIGSSKHLVHRLVAEAFLPTYSSDLTVNHIDGDKANNCVTNLECITQQNNVVHSWALGLSKPRKQPGELHSQASLTGKDVLAIRKLYAKGTYLQRELADKYNVSPGTISDITRRRSWSHI